MFDGEAGGAVLADVLPHLTTPWFMNANRFDEFGAVLAEGGAGVAAVGNDKCETLQRLNLSVRLRRSARVYVQPRRCCVCRCYRRCCGLSDGGLGLCFSQGTTSGPST